MGITRAAIVKNMLEWKVEPGADCLFQMIQQKKHSMILTAPRQCNADARSNLRDRLSFDESKFKCIKQAGDFMWQLISQLIM